MFSKVMRQLSFDFLKETPRVPAGEIFGQHATGMSVAEEGRIQEHRVAAVLSIVLQNTVRVKFTNNQKTMVSSQRRAGYQAVRLHWMFKEADEKVLTSVGLFLMRTSTSGSSRMLNKFICDNQDKIKTTSPRQTQAELRTCGEFYNLDEVLQCVQQQYIGHPLTDVCIGWGRKRTTSKRRRLSRRRSTALATYCFTDQTIRVNPVLDSKKVPRYVIEWIVYHELLHHILPVEKSTNGDRNLYHSRKFKAMERSFPHYQQAQQWERQHIGWLLGKD